MSALKSSRLFPDDDHTLLAAANRPDPVIWVRRVVIVESPRPDAEVVREVELRRGLNIIATAEPRAGDGPVGHNVGKTLFTRLIRYCLGESNFARTRVRESMARILPEAYVVAEVCIGGRWWVVTRPIGEISRVDSWCRASDSWRDVFHDPTTGAKHAVFVDALAQAAVWHITDTLLPHQNRPIRWHDLLAWLSRDQYCRYRDPLEWRTSETESGTVALDPEDASILIRLVMDLLDDEERALIVRHRKLLETRRQQAALVKQSQEDVATTRRFLKRRLRIRDEALADGLFGQAAMKRIRAKGRRLGKTINALPDTSGLSALAETLQTARDAMTQAQSTVDLRLADRQNTEGEIQTLQSKSDQEYVESFDALQHPCPLPPDECPLKAPGPQPGERNPLVEMLIQQKTMDLQTVDQQLEEARKNLTAARAHFNRLNRVYANREKSIAAERRNLERRLARIEATTKEVSTFIAAATAVQAEIDALDAIDRQIRESRESQRIARDLVARKQQTLEQHFNCVLSVLLGPSFRGRIEISLRGVRLVMDEQDSFPGEAMATSGMVHGLDLACLRASIAGLGSFPRFLLHDSPREGDLEPHIYAKLFELAAGFEGAGDGREPSFQYIVTTTTRPPESFADRQYVRLELDARRQSGLLLNHRARFWDGTRD